MAAENTSGFNIDGTLYEVPPLSSFTMDEAQILYDYSGLTLEDFVPGENEDADELEQRRVKLRNPGFLRALMHVSYQRQHPKLSTGEVKRLVGQANIIDALKDLGSDDEEGADAGPPALTSAPGGSSPSGSDGSSGSSGGDSDSGSAGQVVPLAASGTTRSDMSSISDPTRSAL